MILDTFKAQFSDHVESDLLRIENMLLSPAFLAGIGANSIGMIIPPGIPVTSNIATAHDMMTSQNIWNMPRPWPYQYFVGEVEDEVSAYTYGGTMTTFERKARLAVYQDNADGFRKKIFKHFEEVYRSQGIVDFLHEKNLANLRNFKFIVENSFKNEIKAYIGYMLEMTFLVGLKSSSFFTRMIELFEVGGVPCGWLGDVRFSEGADPRQCMAMLHFGKQAS